MRRAERRKDSDRKYFSGEGETHSISIKIVIDVERSQLPELRALYRTYITEEATARILCKGMSKSLSTKDQYIAKLRSMESSSAGRNHLMYQLCLPVLRMQQYAAFLECIKEYTGVHHPDMGDTAMALRQLNIVIEGIKDRCYRLEAIDEVLARSGDKSPWRIARNVFPDLPPMKLLKSVSLVTARSRTRDWYDDQSQKLKEYEQFISTLMQDMITWIQTVRTSFFHLEMWGYRLCAMDKQSIYLGDRNELLGPIDEVILPLCLNTIINIKSKILPVLRKLLCTLKAPIKLVDHILSSRARNKPDWLHRPDASRISRKDRIIFEQLRLELPIFLRHLEKGILLCIKEFVALQAQFWNETRSSWKKYEGTSSGVYGPYLDARDWDGHSLDAAESTLQTLRILRRSIHPKVRLVRNIDEAFAAHIMDLRPSTSKLSGSG